MCWVVWVWPGWTGPVLFVRGAAVLLSDVQQPATEPEDIQICQNANDVLSSHQTGLSLCPLWSAARLPFMTANLICHLNAVLLFAWEWRAVACFDVRVLIQVHISFSFIMIYLIIASQIFYTACFKSLAVIVCVVWAGWSLRYSRTCYHLSLLTASLTTNSTHLCWWSRQLHRHTW